MAKVSTFLILGVIIAYSFQRSVGALVPSKILHYQLSIFRCVLALDRNTLVSLAHFKRLMFFTVSSYVHFFCLFCLICHSRLFFLSLPFFLLCLPFISLVSFLLLILIFSLVSIDDQSCGRRGRKDLVCGSNNFSSVSK